MAASDDFKIIATNVIPEVTEVRFYAETIDHIKEQHPSIPVELPCVSGAIETAIVTPTHVESSRNNSVIFVDASSTDAVGNPLRVPVKIIEGTSGLIKTAFFAETSDEPIVIWRKP